MRPEALAQHTEAIAEGFRESRAKAVRHADPSWYAFQGYVRGTPEGFVGAGHLAWERVARRMAEVQRAKRRAGLSNTRRLAFALGYGLGLRDQGRSSRAGVDALLDALFPPPAARTRIYETSRFWLFVCMLLVFEVSMVAAQEVDSPPYPVWAEPPPQECTDAAQHDRAEGAASQTQVASRLLADAASGIVALDRVRAELQRQPPSEAASLASQLLARMEPKEGAALVDALSRVPGKPITQVLRNTLGHEHRRVVRAALAALIGRGDRDGVVPISQLMNHADPRVRQLAIEAMGVLVQPKRAWLLIQGLHDSNEAVRRASRTALTQVVGRDLGPRARRWWRHLQARP